MEWTVNKSQYFPKEYPSFQNPGSSGDIQHQVGSKENVTSNGKIRR